MEDELTTYTDEQLVEEFEEIEKKKRGRPPATPKLPEPDRVDEIRKNAGIKVEKTDAVVNAILTLSEDISFLMYNHDLLNRQWIRRQMKSKHEKAMNELKELFKVGQRG